MWNRVLQKSWLEQKVRQGCAPCPISHSLLHINEVCKFSVEFEYCKPCHQHAENVTIIYIYIKTRNYGNIIKKLTYYGN